MNGHETVINNGTNGLQRLDRVVATADKYGIKLLLTLTNNWNPERPMPATTWNRRANNDELPRGYLANDYGTLFTKFSCSSFRFLGRGHRFVYSQLLSRWGTRSILHQSRHCRRLQELPCKRGTSICYAPGYPWMGVG